MSLVLLVDMLIFHQKTSDLHYRFKLVVMVILLLEKRKASDI